MNCPKCGRELIIGSNLCPVCDVSNTQEPEKSSKQVKKLTKAGKFVFGALLSLILLIVAFCVALSLRGHIIDGSGNGNYLNGGLAVYAGKHLYYSTEKELCCSDKKLSGKEVIDTGNAIGNLVFENGCLYYTKDGRICEYNPKSRKIKPVCATEADAMVAGFSDKYIFYNDNGCISKLSLDSKRYDKYAYGIGVFDRNKLYYIENSELFRMNPKTYEKSKIATVENYITPVFVKSGRVYCCDQKEQKLISIGIKEGDMREEFSTSDFQNISDVEHVNYCKGYFLLRGENGVYRFAQDSKETVLLYDVGYVKSTIVSDNAIFIYTPDGSAYIADIKGNIKYSAPADKEENKQLL